MSEQQACTEPQAGRYIGVSDATMRFWRSNGTGPRYYRAGKLIRYRKSDLDAWIEARLSAPVASAERAKQ